MAVVIDAKDKSSIFFFIRRKEELVRQCRDGKLREWKSEVGCWVMMLMVRIIAGVLLDVMKGWGIRVRMGSDGGGQ